MKLQSPLLVGVILLAGLMVANRGGHQQAEAKLAELEPHASSQWAVELNIKPESVTVGDLGMTVSVRSARSGYLTLLQRGTDGKEDVIFPNALDKDSRIEADKTLTLPREHWKLRAAPPAGEGRLLALVGERPDELPSPGGFPYGAASATYRERE